MRWLLPEVFGVGAGEPTSVHRSRMAQHKHLEPVVGDHIRHEGMAHHQQLEPVGDHVRQEGMVPLGSPSPSRSPTAAKTMPE